MTNNMHLQGWINKPSSVIAIQSTLPIPVFSEVYAPLKDSGKGKVVLLYEFVEQLNGSFPIYQQTIGDCVAHGAACAVNVLKATEIAMLQEFEEWVGITATEDIYGGSRVQIGNGQLGYGDGSIGAWAGKYVSTYGTLIRRRYDDIDLSTYNGERARDWGNPGKGTPSILLPYAKEHLVRTISQIRTYEEARDAIANGYPVTVACNIGFNQTRDKDGFLYRSGSWAHQQCFIAVDDTFRRPGLLIMNSWGPNWVTGPKRHNQPDGSYWVDADTVNQMLAANDSWAFSNFDGFKPQKLNLRIV